VGDISFARDVAAQVNVHFAGNYSRTLERVRDHLQADIVIANLESVFIDPHSQGDAVAKRILLGADEKVMCSQLQGSLRSASKRLCYS